MNEQVIVDVHDQDLVVAAVTDVVDHEVRSHAHTACCTHDGYNFRLVVILRAMNVNDVDVPTEATVVIDVQHIAK